MAAPIIVDTHAIEAAAELDGMLERAVIDAGGAYQLAERAARGEITEDERAALAPLA